MRELVVRERWSIPREWPGERCFILCNGESLRSQRHLIPQLQGRIIAIKEAVRLRPDADVLFVARQKIDDIMPELFPLFTGQYVIARNKVPVNYPEYVKLISRTKDHTRLCEDPQLVCGLDSGTSAINLAYHFGATEIVLLGMDMIGNRWCKGEFRHPVPCIPESDHARHKATLPDIAVDAKRKGIRIVNCSPISTVTAFERQPLEAFLDGRGAAAGAAAGSAAQGGAVGAMASSGVLHALRAAGDAVPSVSGLSAEARAVGAGLVSPAAGVC